AFAELELERANASANAAARTSASSADAPTIFGLETDMRMGPPYCLVCLADDFRAKSRLPRTAPYPRACPQRSRSPRVLLCRRADPRHRDTLVGVLPLVNALGAEKDQRFGGSERAYAVPTSTHFSSWRFVRTCSSATRSQPCISRPRISISC